MRCGELALNDNALILTPSQRRQIETEGAAAYPNECCGIIYGRDVTDGGITRRVVEELEPVVNEFEAGEQFHRFLITPATLFKAEKKCAGGRLVLGFYHSHPDHPARPSEYDRQHAWPFYSYVIVAIEKGEAKVMTCWLLDEATEQFTQQEINAER
jgi:proteasome lid subunit RPN8/RPN11